MTARAGYPSRLVCLTEETVEILYALGAGDLVVGVSAYAVRPEEVKSKPKVSSFISAQDNKILDLKPDLVLTFSDIQADITRDLVKKGLPVFNFNHRTVDEIYMVIRQVGALVGYHEEADALVNRYQHHVTQIQEKASKLNFHPKVYFEEWNDPLITGISWVSELITMAGGIECFPELAHCSLAKERVVSHEQVIDANPDLVLASWCGKKFDEASFMNRAGYEKIKAVKNKQVFEIDSSIILQPGPAALTDGLDTLYRFISQAVS